MIAVLTAMPPKGTKMIAMTPAQATAARNSLVTRWFTPAPEPPKRGRPSLPFKKRGRKPEVQPRAVSPEMSFAQVVVGVAAAPAAAPAPVAKRKRTNWSKGEPFERLTTAVNNWLNKTGALLTEDPDMSKLIYARRVMIPYDTLYAYLHPNVALRRPLGSKAGKPSLVHVDAQQFCVDVLVRRDRGNDGLNNREAVDLVHDLAPELTRNQARDVFRKTIRPSNKDTLTNIVKAQASTTKRSGITVPQQFRWHKVLCTSWTCIPAHSHCRVCACSPLIWLFTS